MNDPDIEEMLGIREGAADSPPGEGLIGYHASGVDALVRMFREVPVRASDVFVDIGSGLGKVVMLAKLHTGAKARGIEIQPELVRRAREAAAARGLDVRFDAGDARDADLSDGTVFFLYAPFEREASRQVMDRLRAVADDHPIVVCALGMDLERDAPWLKRRPGDDFWLAIYDGAAPARAVLSGGP